MTKGKALIEVIVADDHAIFRDGLRKLLQSDDNIAVVGEAQDGAECIRLVTKLKPDILLLDLRMPVKDGLAVLEELDFDKRCHLCSTCTQRRTSLLPTAGRTRIGLRYRPDVGIVRILTEPARASAR
jgi:CheY-like chemotaxis protein